MLKSERVLISESIEATPINHASFRMVAPCIGSILYKWHDIVLLLRVHSQGGCLSIAVAVVVNTTIARSGLSGS